MVMVSRMASPCPYSSSNASKVRFKRSSLTRYPLSFSISQHVRWIRQRRDFSSADDI